MGIQAQIKRPRDTRKEQVSVDPWEVEYMHRQFPTHSREEIEKELGTCKKELRGERDRKRVMSCLRRKLG